MQYLHYRVFIFTFWMSTVKYSSNLLGLHFRSRLKRSEGQEWKNSEAAGTLSFFPTQMLSLPYAVRLSLTLYLAIYLKSQFLIHYCLTLHLPFLFICVITKLYFLPLYKLSLLPSLPVCLWSLLQTTSIVRHHLTWMEDRREGKIEQREGNVNVFSWSYLIGPELPLPSKPFTSQTQC